ncbi:MAG: L-lysine exporter family protein LysE/ArgO [Mycobacterium sp.]|nr:L-lysine exporter family protein LysE/ArgO [Mycobacterium sp.]
MISPVLIGFATSLTLIVAIGAQNAFVLRQGIRGQHVLTVVTLCTMADVVLIAAGVAGFGILMTAHPQAITVARFGGAAFLLGYGVLAAVRALRPGSLEPADAPVRAASVVLTCLALTFLNPHVYLDTVVLLGALANEQHGSRCLFGFGAACASAIWFATLGFGARRVQRLFATPAAWRILDGLIAVTMLGIAAALLV